MWHTNGGSLYGQWRRVGIDFITEVSNVHAASIFEEKWLPNVPCTIPMEHPLVGGNGTFKDGDSFSETSVLHLTLYGAITQKEDLHYHSTTMIALNL